MKVYRLYSLPEALLADFDLKHENRSKGIEEAIYFAVNNDHVLAQALTNRLTSGLGPSKTKRVRVSIEERAAALLDFLSRHTQLPTEHALRLAMEGYIQSR